MTAIERKDGLCLQSIHIQIYEVSNLQKKYVLWLSLRIRDKYKKEASLIHAVAWDLRTFLPIYLLSNCFDLKQVISTFLPTYVKPDIEMSLFSQTLWLRPSDKEFKKHVWCVNLFPVALIEELCDSTFNCLINYLLVYILLKLLWFSLRLLR